MAFLYNGRYFTLSQRLTRKVMAHVDPNECRTVSFEYLNQQLVWGELQQFVMFLLPLLTPGSLAANNFLASATAKMMRFCHAPRMYPAMLIVCSSSFCSRAWLICAVQYTRLLCVLYQLHDLQVKGSARARPWLQMSVVCVPRSAF